MFQYSCPVRAELTAGFNGAKHWGQSLAYNLKIYEKEIESCEDSEERHSVVSESGVETDDS